MTDLGNAFVLLFVTLGPKKLIPGFFLLTHEADWRTIWVLALKSTIVATGIALFTALSTTGLLAKWHVSMDSVAIAGSIVLLMTSIKALSVFKLGDIPAAGTADIDKATEMRWLGRPVLSPVAIPMVITPVGVVVILFFSGQAVGYDALKLQLIGMLLAIMAVNFVSMILAGPIVRAIGLPIWAIFGWLLSAVQAGLAVEMIVAALRRLHVIP